MKKLFSLYLIFFSCVILKAQYISNYDNPKALGYRYSEAHVEGYIDGKLYNTYVNDFIVMHLKDSDEYRISADCGEYSLFMQVRHHHYEDNRYYYSGKCRLTRYSPETGQKASSEVTDVRVMTKSNMKWFRACQGMDKSKADSLSSSKGRFSGSRDAIHVMLKDEQLVFVPVVNKDGNNLVEYHESEFAAMPNDSTMRISGFSNSLYSGIEMRLQSVMNKVLKDYGDNEIEAIVTDSLAIDSKGHTSHCFKIERFIPENNELEKRLLDRLVQVRFRPVELKQFSDRSGDVINVYDTFSLEVLKSIAPIFKRKDLSEFNIWVNRRLRYPEECRRNGIEGDVLVSFVIDVNGKITDVEVLESDHPLFAKEVLRIVRVSPKWSPGKRGDANVRVAYTMPVFFRLR